MEDKKAIIENSDGTVNQIEILTYLKSTDGLKNYAVYHANETQGLEEDHIIYISKLALVGNRLQLIEIEDNAEWLEVQSLLKPIANNK